MMFDFEVWKVFKFTIWDLKSIVYNSAIIINVTTMFVIHVLMLLFLLIFYMKMF
jgi:hypothetical protein